MDKYAVIGHPVEHSKSPQIYQAFARQTNQVLDYIKVEAPIDGFIATVRDLQDQGFKGANITLPFKQQAYCMATVTSDAAKKAEAANTLMFREDGSIFADNTDGVGLIQDLTNNHQYSLRQKKILVLGGGGAVRTIMGSLLEKAPLQIIVANRTAEKAKNIANQFKLNGELRGIGLDELEPEPYDLIINATSAGLTGDFPNLPGELITNQTLCYDLLYADQTTPFIKWAQQFNPTQCLDGSGMLVEQAAAAFYLWRGVYPDTKPVIEMLKETSS